MKVFTKWIMTFALLCIAGMVNAAEYEIDQKFTSVADLEGQLFCIVNEADGKAIYNKDAQNLAYDSYSDALSGTAYLWKIHSLAEESDSEVLSCFTLEAVKADGSSIGLWGNPAIYLNSGAEGGFDGCFVLGLNNQFGQDLQYGGIWEIEYADGQGFALKNKARGGYFTGVNPAPSGSDPVYWTFGTLKEKENTDPTPEPTEITKYYIQNIASGLWWGAGNAWGTQASLLQHPEYVTLAKMPDGTYTMESQVSNGDKKIYFNGSYMDSDTPVSLTLSETNGKYTIAKGDIYYGYNGENTIIDEGGVALGDNAYWKLFTESEMLASLAKATKEKPANATFLILDPNFGRNNRNKGAWTGDEFSVGGENTNFNAEKWGGNSETFDISQSVEAPNGLYKITWNGFYRYNNTTENTNDVAVSAHADGTEAINSFVYINGTDYPLMSIADDEASTALGGTLPFSQKDATAAFEKGIYEQNAEVTVEDGKLTIGIKKTSHPGCDWTVWDNFRISYLGNGSAPAADEDPELVAPEGWTSVITNGNLAGDDVTNYIAKEYPATDPVGATIAAGAGKNESRGIIVKSQDKAANPWDSQFWINMNETLPAGTKVHVEFDYKADNAGKVGTQSHAAPGNYLHWAAIGDVEFTTEWQHFSNDFTVASEANNMQSIAFNLNDVATANNYYFDNFGVWIEKLAPVSEWTDLIVNGDIEGGNMECFYVTEQGVGGPFLALATAGIGKDGSKAVKIQSADEPAQDWDTQFFVRLPYQVPAGTKFKFSFDYKASVEGGADTQCHNEPGQYIHYTCAGSPTFTTEWQHYENEGIVASQCDGSDNDGGYKNIFQTIAFNLAKNKVATEFIIDNVKFEVPTDVVASLEKNPAVDPTPYPVPLEEGLVEITQDQGKTLDDFARTELVEGDDYNTYTATADLQVAFKMYDIDVKDCDYVVVKFAEPVAKGWCIAFWAQGGTDNVEIPEGSTEYKYVFTDDPKCAIANDILPQICMLTLWGAEKPLVAKVTGIYKHQVAAPVETAHTWDFTKWSEETVANLKAESAKVTVYDDPDKEGNTMCTDNGALWSDHEKAEGKTCDTYTASKDNCFWSMDEETELTANGVAIAELKGLIFDASYAKSRSIAIAVNYPSTSLGTYNGPSYLWLGGKGKTCFTIPAVKGGSIIKIGVESHKSSDARGVQLIAGETELTDPEGNAVTVPTTYVEQTWQVPAGEAVNVTVKNTNGCHIYFIDAEQDEDALTSISTVKSTIAQDGIIYNLSGQKMSGSLKKGLYIINGKKVVIK